nr:MAG TPA: hypothetical protein [Caudoviricetes sp.]
MSKCTYSLFIYTDIFVPLLDCASSLPPDCMKFYLSTKL